MTIRSLFYTSSIILLAGITSIQCSSSDDTSNPVESVVYEAGRNGYNANYRKNGTAVLLRQESGSSDVKGMAIVGDYIHNVGYEIKKSTAEALQEISINHL